MSIKELIVPSLAAYKFKSLQKALHDPVLTQQRIFEEHLIAGVHTSFGKEHFLKDIRIYSDFKKAVPLRTYEQFRTYVDRITEGEKDVLWPGIPQYFAKTSGTSSGAKYIPVTRESLKCQRQGRLYLMVNYIAGLKRRDALSGNILLFSEHHVFEMKGKIPAGAISGILSSGIPSFLKRNYLPSKETNLITDYDQKLTRMVEESITRNVTSIVAMPPWLLMYLNRLKEITGKTFSEVFPNFALLSVSGMNVQPYLKLINEHIHKPYDQLETYPSSEGFIAYKDRLNEEGLALVLNQGIFYEFVPIAELDKPSPARYSIGEVKLNEEYAIVLNTNAGLWGYVLGDTVKFVSLSPPRIVITGRISQYLTTFGERTSMKDVEVCLAAVCKEFNISIVEFTVAPVLKSVANDLSYYEWLIEFDNPFSDAENFSRRLDELLCNQNFYYKDLVESKAIRSLVVKPVRKNGFLDFAKNKGRVGGQYKMVHLHNRGEDLAEFRNFIA